MSLDSVLFPFGQFQAAAALLQKNTSNNNPYFSLTILSTAAIHELEQQLFMNWSSSYS